MSDLIAQIEKLNKQNHFSSIKYNGEYVWPYLRILLGLSFKKEVKTKLSKKILIKGIFYGFYCWLRFSITPRKASIFMLSSGHYKVEEERVLYDKFLYHFQNELDKSHTSYLVSDFYSDFIIPKNLSYAPNYHPTQFIIIFLSIFWRIQFEINKNFWKGPISEFLESISDTKLDITNNIEWKVFFLLKQSNYFKKVLIKAGVRRVLVVCYYDNKSLALVKAANELGIDIMDIQHGVQGKNHVAYTGWNAETIKNSNFFPSHFWVWSSFDKKNLNQVFSEKHIIKGGNLWLNDHIQHKEKKFILFTAQGLGNNFPSQFLDSIKLYNGDLQWKIRLHPRQRNSIPLVRNLFRSQGILHKVEIVAATNDPLTSILQETAIHITQFSSVVLEAYSFNIPSIVIEPKGVDYYKDQLPKEFLKKGFNSHDILVHLNEIQKIWKYDTLKNSNIEFAGNSQILKFFKLD
tara:strand:- start:3975 stop:5357 length:1383 start_codon:yes stop_codon:yes gene_type:complete